MKIGVFYFPVDCGIGGRWNVEEWKTTAPATRRASS